MGLKRGDIVLVAAPGEFGKPRPALIVQSDSAFPSGYVTYLPITSNLLRVPDVRIPVMPNAQNGLRLPSEVMVDMIQTSSLAKFDQTIGTIDEHTLQLVEASLSLHLGLDE
jgi:mRNA interferase MazF